MKGNIGYLTGTHTGANNYKSTKAATAQVKDLAMPKASFKQRKLLKSDSKKDVGGDENNSVDNESSRNASIFNTQFNSSTSQLVDYTNNHIRKRKNPASVNRDGAVTELDTLIKKTLRKDPRLPELNSFESSKVLRAVRQSQRLRHDKDTMRNLREVLSMRESLLFNQPGQVINGRKLLKPVPLRTSVQNTKRSSIHLGQESYSSP